MTTIYLIRHGITDYNIQGRFQGVLDISLNEEGHQQSKCLVPYFDKIHLDKLYISPLHRAKQTAAYLAKEKGLTPIIKDGLKEFDGGELEGKSEAETLKYYPECNYNIKYKFHLLDAPSGENSKQAFERIIKAIEEIGEENNGKTIAVVTHGFVLQLFLSYASKIPFEKIELLMDLKNASIHKLQMNKNKEFKIEYMNDISHLQNSIV